MDAHVHLRACFSTERFLDAATANLKRERERLGSADSLTGCLWLTEAEGDHPFHCLAARAGGSPYGEWRFERTEEEESLYAVHGDGTRLLLIAGLQVQSREGLEVLALGTRTHLEPGLAFDEVVSAIADTGALPVVPWGFGKWVGRRGRELRSRLQATSLPSFCLGDNAGRPRGLDPPSVFEIARRRGVPILPGSDPPPVADMVSDVARYGFVLEAAFDPSRPGQDLVRWLQGLSVQPETFGRRVGPLPFLWRQARVRTLKTVEQWYASCV